MQHELYSGEKLVAIFKDYTLKEIIDKSRLPLYFNRSTELKPWLESRAIDSHRPSSRLLKKALRFTDYSDLATVLSQYALTLTDNYWLKESNDKKKYSQLSVDFNNEISELALNCSYSSFNNISNSHNKITYELTNIGSFEKCWYLIDKKWYLKKKATTYEAFSELFCYYLAKHLNFEIAEYSIDNNQNILSENFTKTTNLEPMWNLVDDCDDYEITIKTLKNIKCKSDLIEDFIKIIYIDTLVGNPDRHTKNYGLLRNRENGEIISMAPNYDNNLALISTGLPKYPERPNDILVKLFLEILNKYSEYKAIIYAINLDKNIINNIIEKINTNHNITIANEEKEIVTTFVLSAYNQIKNNI